MNKIENVDSIDRIEFSKNITLYCPLGYGYYLAKVSVDITPDEILMDYLDIEEFFKSMEGQEFIIEEAVAKIHDFLKTHYRPLAVIVKVTAESNVHFPVTVTKY